jgi:hypothetical protein
MSKAYVPKRARAPVSTPPPVAIPYPGYGLTTETRRNLAVLLTKVGFEQMPVPTAFIVRQVVHLSLDELALLLQEMLLINAEHVQRCVRLWRSVNPPRLMNCINHARNDLDSRARDLDLGLGAKNFAIARVVLAATERYQYRANIHL